MKIDRPRVPVEKNQVSGQQGEDQRAKGEPSQMKAGFHPLTFMPRFPSGKED